MKRTPTPRRSWGSLRTMRSGRIQASYIADDGRRYYCPHTFDSRMDAAAWLHSERKLIERGEWTAPETRAKTATFMTLREYIEQEWLPQRSLSPKSRATYRELQDLRILPHLGDEFLPAITPQMVRAWRLGLNPDTPHRNDMAYRHLKSIFNTAVEETLIKENPCQLKVSAPKPRDVEFLSPQELTVVAKSVPEHYRAAVYVLAFCALRFGELIELRRKDVHMVGDRMVLKIQRSAVRVDNKIVVGTTKTVASMRTVHVPPHVADMLREHMTAHTGNGPESLLFTTTRGGRLTKGAFTKSLKKGYASVGKNMCVHDLRAIGGTLAAMAGATLKETMARLGHENPRTAMRYQIAAADRDAFIADRLSELAG